MIARRRALLGCSGLSALLLVLAAAAATAAPTASTTAAPHIITIILDDVGWNDVGWRGGPMPTPAIDALSARGIRLDRHYVHPVCTPSRMSLMTGKYSHLSGWPSASIIIGPAPFTLPAGTRTLPKELRARGYAAHAVGKWHLGGNRLMNTPVGSTWGFETFTGLIHGAGGHYSKTVSGPEGLAGAFYDYARAHENGTWAPFHDDRHSTVSLTEEAIAVMQRHADSNGNGNSNGHEAAHGQNTEGEAHEAKKRASSPLFLYVAYTAGHTPLQADDAWLAKCTHLPHAYRRDYCGLLYGVDEGIRNLTAAAQRLLGDNIIVMLTSDNGGMLHQGGNNQPLRGGKNTAFEGGVRSLAFVTDLTPDGRHLGAGGRTFDGLMQIADWMPTFASIADAANAKADANAKTKAAAEAKETARGNPTTTAATTETATANEQTSKTAKQTTSASAQSTQAAAAGEKAAAAESEVEPEAQTEPELGHGYDMRAVLRSGRGDDSPRADAVLILDEGVNMAAYIRKPYKLMVGHFGDGSWSVEPTGRYLYNNDTNVIDMIEQEAMTLLDHWFGSRDISFFWHEIVHIVGKQILRRWTQPGRIELQVQ